MKKNIIKGMDYLIQAANNDDILAFFPVGYFYLEGKYVTKDIDKAIKYFKDASSFNSQYAKNNLGIIYRHGISGKILKNIGYAIEYFKENISRFSDILSMYNLAHIFIYDEGFKEKIDEAIDLLVKCSNQNFSPAIDLLSIALIIKYKFDLKQIYNDLEKRTDEKNNLQEKIHKIIDLDYGLNHDSFEEMYTNYKTIDFLYDFFYHPIVSKKLNEINEIKSKNTNLNKITSDFYDGFGHDI